MTLPFSVDPLLLASGGYQISRSVRLRSAASAYFNKTPSVTGSLTTYTLSCWVKRGSITSDQALISARNNGGNGVTYLYFDTSDKLHFFDRNSSLTVQGEYSTNAVFRDPSAWYHVVCVVNTTQATAANRFSVYINGVQQTLTTSTAFAQNTTTLINASGQAEFVGSMNPTYGVFFDGYFAEYNFIDGQALTASSFGFTDSNGIWQPKAYTGTYGTNGFYLKFTDNSAATATTLGKDYSGNGNNWTPNNISVTAGVTYDSMLDSPTNSAGASNYAVLNPLISSTNTFSNANLTVTMGATVNSKFVSTIGAASGKYYMEFTTSAWSTTPIGITSTTVPQAYLGSSDGSTSLSFWPSSTNTNLYVNSVLQSWSGSTTTWATGDVAGLALDVTNSTIALYKNNVLVGSAYTYSSFWTGLTHFAGGNYISGLVYNANFGQRPFTYTPPAGFVALNTYNIPAATINNGATVMAASTYTGTGATQSIVNSGNNAAATSFKPDLVWIKGRNVASNNVLIDSVRGAFLLVSDLTDTEISSTPYFSSINSNGFTVTGTSAASNQSGESLIGWQWQAGQGTTSSNTNGSITSTVSVNVSAGFSVVTYTGTGANATVGHGLGVAPKMVIVKARTSAQSWVVQHTSLTSGAYTVYLNATAAQTSVPTVWNSAFPTTTVFSIGTNVLSNSNTITYVAYCWSEVAGYSKFGSYTGNGSTDGPFIYCGFRPRFVLTKNTTTGGAGYDWWIWDSSRNTYNAANSLLFPDLSVAEVTGAYEIDFLSNGFKLRTSNAATNASANTMIFAAFAENPFTIARAR